MNKKKKYIIALDQGTTSCRSILFDNRGRVIDITQREISQIYPKNAWVEHNPEEIIQTQTSTLIDLLKNNKIDAADIDSIGITNQRETTVLWNKETGKAVYNAIVWQDNRTKDICKELKDKGIEGIINRKTGLILDSYFSATKIKWILDNVPCTKKLIYDKKLLFGTIDSWLIWNLSNKRLHATDISNASRTLLYNIQEEKWDDDLLNIFSIDKSILPEVKESSDDFSYWVYNDTKIPIRGVAGDQQAALFGQSCFEEGMAKNTYGTGCFLLMNTGSKMVKSNNGLLSTVAWKINGKTTYALEGSVFIAGAAIQWLRDGLKIITSAHESEKKAKKSKKNELVFVPAFSGLGAPYWNMNVKGAIFGITRDIGINELCRATLESLAFQTRDVLKAMELDSKIKLDSLYVDGGASNNNFLMQFQADILNTKINKPLVSEATALGAAYLAGLYTKFFSLSDLKKNNKIDSSFSPIMKKEIRNKKINLWNKAIKTISNH